MEGSILLATLLVIDGIGGALGVFFKSKVCYEDLGCFSTHHPFNGYFVELPASPNDVQTRTYLWTRDNPVVPHELVYTDPNSIARSKFDPRRLTKIMMHGFESSMETCPITANLSGAFLKMGDYNVIGVDWSKGAKQFYPKATANTRVVGAVVAKLITTLQDKFDMDLTKLHVLGHSLGAHAAGFVGRRVPGISRITGLDPAGPMFCGADPAARLDPTDALFVDVIHSDGGPVHDAGFGTLEPMGDQDYYPNGGQVQPGCPPPVSTTLEQLVTFRFTTAFNTVSCAHDRAIWYFIESVLHRDCLFLSFPCDSWSHYQAGRCTSCGPVQNVTCPQMGINSSPSGGRGSFYLRTKGTTPFCGVP